jgi:hypothetical protein
MIFLAPTKAIIHFVGIVALTTSLPKTTGLEAVLPRIPATPAIVVNQQQIEVHQAAIVFRRLQFLASTNWKVRSLPNGYQYVELDGEVVTVAGAAINKKSPPPTLPKIGVFCHGGTLKPDFVSPYSGAAAVIAVPAGEVSACNPPVVGGTLANPRLDTEVVIDTVKGILILTATDPKRKVLPRTLTLRDNRGIDIGIEVANLPPRYLNGDASPALQGQGLGHYHAYQSMVAANQNCDMPASQPAPTCKLTDLPALTVDASLLPKHPHSAAGGHDETTAFNFQCSNSQWP